MSHQSFYVGVERPGKLALIYRRRCGVVEQLFTITEGSRGKRKNVYATLKIFSGDLRRALDFNF